MAFRKRECVSRLAKPIRMKFVIEMGRPPPGGEEAEVVVYQPRGVGLMHTRHKPSDAHYTHGIAGGRKYRNAGKLAGGVSREILK